MERLCVYGVRGWPRHARGRASPDGGARIGFRGGGPRSFATGGRAAGSAGPRWRARGGRVGGAIEEGGFQGWNAIDAPGGIGEFLGELGFGGSSGLVFIEEAATMRVVRGAVFGGEDGGGGCQAMAERVQRGTLLAGIGAGPGGEPGVGAVDGGAIHGTAMDGRDWCS